MAIHIVLSEIEIYLFISKAWYIVIVIGLRGKVGWQMKSVLDSTEDVVSSEKWWNVRVITLKDCKEIKGNKFACFYLIILSK